jgi:hypothetical protein
MSEINHFKVLYYGRLCERWFGNWCMMRIFCTLKEWFIVGHRNIRIVDTPLLSSFVERICRWTLDSTFSDTGHAQ